jgi:hypothetical protein
MTVKNQATINARVWVPVCFWSNAGVAIVLRPSLREEVN